VNIFLFVKIRDVHEYILQHIYVEILTWRGASNIFLDDSSDEWKLNSFLSSLLSTD
jgi:hypothetical protein